MSQRGSARRRKPDQAGRLGPTLAAAIALVAAGACAPRLPAAVDKEALADAISKAVGDPATCVLIGKAGSGAVAFRYNGYIACQRPLPACREGATQSAEDLLKATARSGAASFASCSSTADGSRSVGWAAGPVAGRDLVYAALMEGDRAFPGRVMAERLEGAFRTAKLSPQESSTP